MLGEIRAMQVYTMTRKNSKKYLHSTISYKYKIVLWKFFYAGSQIRAVQIRAMRNRASRGMTVVMCTKGAPCSGFPRNLGLVQKRKKSSPDILKKHPKNFHRFDEFQ